MLVKDAMTDELEFVSISASIREAANKMKEKDIGFLPVHDGGQAVGTLTDRDIAVRGVSKGKLDASVEEVMTPGVTSIRAEASLVDAARLMRKEGVRRLPVVDKSERLCGVLSLGDIALRAESYKTPAETLARLSRTGRNVVRH